MSPKNTTDDKDKDIFLGDAINTATRPVHTKLNKLILLRLPLAIPPRATNSSSYVSGILHVAPLYICFESLWHAAIHGSPSTSTSPDDLEQCTFLLPATKNLPQPSPRIHQILTQLFIPGLVRSTRLRADLRSLTSQSDAEIQSRIEETAASGRLGEMVSHIRRSIERHPHVLLSYAWVLYMALFSGGRFIRATLENAGRANHDFWAHPTEGTTSHGPLQFFHFPTPQDGEDLKLEFKARLAEQGRLLTEEERGDIVREAVCIFENLILVIAQLDDVCHTRVDDLRSPLEELADPFGGRSGFRIRDSVLVAKERAARRTGSEIGGSSLDQGVEEGGDEEGRSEETEEEEEGDEGEEEEVEEQEEEEVAEETSESSASSSSGSDEGSPVVDLDPNFAAQLARAVHFGAKLPVPQRTESGNVLLFASGKAQPKQSTQNDGASDTGLAVTPLLPLAPEKVETPVVAPIQLTANAWNIAACVGSLAVALVLIYYRL